MLLPMVEPTDSTKRKMNKNTMWTLTCRSTAVRLIGAALRHYEISLRKDLAEYSRRIPHQLRLMSREHHQSVRPWGIPDLCASQQQLVRAERNLLGNATA